MRRGLSRFGACALVAATAGGGAAAESATACAWKLGVSDMARYDRRRVTMKNGEESLGSVELTTLHGHDLRDGGLYLPVTPTRDLLPTIFALRTPNAGAFEWRIHLHDAVELRIKGTSVVVSQGAAAVESIDATFASSGKAGPFDSFELKDGRAKATISFDVALGVVKSARVETTYVREKSEPKKTDKPANVNETWTFAFAGIDRVAYPKFVPDVNAAIDRGVAHLRTLQKDDGAFDPLPSWDLGTTALCTYTLASCGAKLDDPAVEKALALLCAASPTKTYEQAVCLMAVERAYTPPDEVPGGKRRPRGLPADRRAWAERTAAALEGNCSSPGLWGYPYAGNSLVRADSSNTQYAVLGLQAASRLGIAVKEASWLGVVRHFTGVRDLEGARGSVLLLRAGQAVTETAAALAVPKVAGFRYSTNEDRTWGSMTCAGIASLAIVRDELRRAKCAKFGGKQEEEVDAMIAGGWAWLDQHWGTNDHPGKPHDWFFYFLYSLERAAVLDGVQRVGGKDWYFEGAAELLARQAKDGSWDENAGTHVTETCFALLFLKRATAPLTAATPK
jgi:hypothetical protein